jgi:beta-RFAP synthase
MIRVQTGSRLHFGLLNLSPDKMWTNWLGEEVLPARHYGGVGLMVERPGLRLTAEPAVEWTADGPLAERVLGCAKRIVRHVSRENLQPLHFQVCEALPEHMGLGSGTQLALAVARAMAAGLEKLGAPELAHVAGRGLRSALGVHGFAHGGFLVEAGKISSTEIAPLILQSDFPPEWPVVIVLPSWGQGLHGKAESEAFGRLSKDNSALAAGDALCRVVLLGILPALRSRDWQTFGEAVYDYNVRAGAVFAPIQGGVYTHTATAELVRVTRRFGVPGVGQSSWGPAVFAIARDMDQAAALAREIQTRFELEEREVLVTRARNHGATAEQIDY